MDRCSRVIQPNVLIMERVSRAVLLGLFLLCVVQVDGYSKYGRTCKDIGCRSNEICVMAEDPCTLYSRNECGRYPTCTRRADAGGLSCTTMICPTGQYCKTENGQPTCVNTNQNLGYDSAGVSSVNGHRTSNNENSNNSPDHVSTNTNPYANANAPPVEESGRNYPVSSGTNLGYPPYPSNTNNNNNHGNSGSGYPPYPSNSGSGSPPSSGTNLGYPPYPTQNRMPMPGQTGVYQQPPPQAGGYYPGNSASGYPSYPTNQQYPGHSNYPYQTRNYNSNAHYPRYRNSATRATVAQATSIGFVGIVLMIATKYLS